MSALQSNAAGSASDDNRGPALQSYLIVLFVITYAAIGLRFWSRSLASPRPTSTLGRRRFWWDDWVALASVPFITVEFALIFYMISQGLGRHANALSASQILNNIETIYVVYFIYDTGLWLTKLSALLFLSRVFPFYANSTWFNWGLGILYATNAAWLLGIILGTLLMCDPIAKGYNPNIPGHCNPLGNLWLGSAIPSVVIDLFILLLPLPKVWTLQMNGTRKIGITLAFVLGYLVIIVSLGRLITVVKSEAALSSDLTYVGVSALYWLCAEAPITLASICVPALLPLWRHLVSHFSTPITNSFSRGFRSRTGQTGGIRSETGEFTKGPDMGSGYYGGGQNENTQYNLSSFNDGASSHSRDSRRQIIVVPPSHQQYKAKCQGGESGSPRVPVPEQSIYVAKTVEINVARQ
ncbi:hypothetical protein F5Y16DRAFT_410719 [Xylariaceae sp. FL0255]|nr:hypothetical protein F5Y16DRAFT_410719 [Xylariaceae sp. FL0255]